MNKIGLLLLITGFLFIAVGFSALNPLFEAPDENHHFFVARYIAKTWSLPVADINSPERQEAAQSPLYYFLAAVISIPFGVAESEPHGWLNIYAQADRNGDPINLNMFIHDPDKMWSQHGYALPAHTIRLLSVIFGVGTIVSIYLAAQLLWPEELALRLTAAGLVAFLPQFGFLHGVITNDTIVIFFCSLTILMLIKVWLTQPRTADILILGIFVGAAILSKMTGLVLLVFIFAALSIYTLLFVRSGKMLGNIVLFFITALLMSGWLLWRNYQLYEDITATRIFVEFGSGERPYSLTLLMHDWDRIWKSMIGTFGWMAIVVPDWILVIWVSIMAASFVGAGIGLTQQIARARLLKTDLFSTGMIPLLKRLSLALVLGVWPLAVIAAWLQFIWRTPADQGRLLFPALLPVALFAGYGLTKLGRPWLPLAVLACALVTSVYSAYVILPSAYAQPRVMTEDQIPRSVSFLDQDMGAGVQLVAAELTTRSLHPGERFHAKLYWRLNKQPTHPALVAPELVGRNYERIGSLPLSYHGNGLYPSTLWHENTIVVQDLTLQVADDAQVPTEGRLLIRLEGEEPLVTVGSFKVVPKRWPALIETDVTPKFGDGIKLTSATVSNAKASPGSDLEVKLRWAATGDIHEDLTIFVHLGDPSKPPVAQSDGPPVQGDYPTHWWTAGEIIDDVHILTLPNQLGSGQYPISVGLYNPKTGTRVPVYVGEERAENDAVEVATVTVHGK
jgi:hypothetical protein